jgi:DNA segregation ATPase FtsK/SpoIIIE, S-DNA-T family
MNKKLKQEVTGILFMIIAVLTGISLATYSPSDVLSLSRFFLIENAMGIAGVFISHVLIKYGLGYFSWGIVFLIFVWGWTIFSGKELKKTVRFTVYWLLFILVSALLTTIIQNRHLPLKTPDFDISGFIGGSLSVLLMDWIGLVPSVILLAVMLVVIVCLFFRWSMYKPLNVLWNKWKKYYQAKKALRQKRKNEKKKESSREKSQKEEIKKSQRTAKKTTEIQKPLQDIRKEPVELKPEKEKSEEEKPAKKKKSEPEELPSSQDPYDFEVSEKRGDDSVDYDDFVEEAKRKEYHFPSVDLLNDPPPGYEIDPNELQENADILTKTLADFGVSGKVVKVVPGPVVTLYEVEPATGVRVSKISSLSDDIARVMAAKRIRIIAPIPGKKVVGVEIPNRKPEVVYFKSIVNSERFTVAEEKLFIALGKTANGEPFVFNLAKMPHLLIAGTTGSGKSVCINTLLMSILYRAKPTEVKFILIDPKKLELSVYKALKEYHLITNDDIGEHVITRPQNAVLALRSAEVEMERRYSVLANATVRNIDEYNKKVDNGMEGEHLPYLLIVIDELADLMLTAGKEIEEPIARLAQMARAVGIHLVIATQRPSVDVITGVIRSNFPARIGFQVPTKIDSRTILDTGGAEKLLGKGDMLFLSPGRSEPIRIHNSFITLEEIERVMSHINEQPNQEDDFILPSAKEEEEKEREEELELSAERDPLFEEALKLVVMHQQGSISLIQRRLRVGYSRAARLIDELEKEGIVGPFTGSKAREVLVDTNYLEHLKSLEDGSFEDENDDT